MKSADLVPAREERRRQRASPRHGITWWILIHPLRRFGARWGPEFPEHQQVEYP